MAAPSRAKRWADAISRGKEALAELQSALDDLQGLKDEYEEWKGNLPENLENSALGEKLSAVCDLDVPDTDEIESYLDEAEALDLPQGFGRD